jgi:hypothetical protein
LASLKTTLPNTVAAIQRQFIAKIGSKTDTLVVCEASGAYQHVANPRQVCDFAKGHGVLEKSRACGSDA